MHKSYKGWYKLLNHEKFIKPIDTHMRSYCDGYVNYKSRLELKAIKYADLNTQIIRWSLEPFHITYLKPTDKKIHRYFFDLFLEFKSSDKLLVEIKSKSETIPPKIPKNKSQKSLHYYKRALQTYSINAAKWDAANKFAKDRGMRFIFLTEDQLG